MIDFTKALKPSQAAPSVPTVAIIKSELAKYDEQIDRLAVEASAIQVRDDQTVGQAVELAAGAKKLAKALEDRRKAVIADPDDFVRSVNRLVKSYRDRLDRIEADCKRAIGGYQARVEMERRKAQQLADEAARQAQDRINAEAQAHHVEPVQVAAPIVPTAPTVTRTEAGTGYTKRAWTFEVESEADVPREFCTPDPAKLRNAVASGIREIPGVKIFEKDTVVIRG